MGQIKAGISALLRIWGAAGGCIFVFPVCACVVFPWRSMHMLKQSLLEEKSSEFSSVFLS